MNDHKLYISLLTGAMLVNDEYYRSESSAENWHLEFPLEGLIKVVPDAR